VCVCVWYLGVNSGLHVHKSGTLTTWATLSTQFCAGYFRDRVLWTISLGRLQTMILLISASWVPRIMDMRLCLALAICVCVCVCAQYWSLNSKPCAYKAGTVPLFTLVIFKIGSCSVPEPQSSYLYLPCGWTTCVYHYTHLKWVCMNFLPGLASNHALPISALGVARVTGFNDHT
jgi:hypothetical protein